jgi:hypothetical protein
MLKGKTSTGFEYELSDGALSDWEVLEELVNIDEGHYSAAVKLLTLLLGAEQGKLLKEHCRDRRSGRIPRDKVLAELGEILRGVGSEDGKEKNG